MSKSEAYMVDFIDALFAVTIGASFTQILIESWFYQYPWIWNESTWFEVATLGFAYLTVILSWQGYHESIKKYSIRDAPRFYIDILLLIQYFLLLVKYKNFLFELCLLIIIYFFYILWDHFKVKEIRKDNNLKEQDKRGLLKDYQPRNKVTIIWLFIFIILTISYYAFISSLSCFNYVWSARAIMNIKWSFLIGAISGILLYRIHKKCLWFVKNQK